ncbi:hypothetical protein [Streptomyces sp. NPDC005004]
MTTAWFVTGASSGFGRLLTGRLSARGDRHSAGAGAPPGAPAVAVLRDPLPAEGTSDDVAPVAVRR